MSEKTSKKSDFSFIRVNIIIYLRRIFIPYTLRIFIGANFVALSLSICTSRHPSILATIDRHATPCPSLYKARISVEMMYHIYWTQQK